MGAACKFAKREHGDPSKIEPRCKSISLQCIAWTGQCSDKNRSSLTISAKSVSVGGVAQRLIRTGKRSGLQTHIAVTMAAMGNPLAVKVLSFVKN